MGGGGLAQDDKGKWLGGLMHNTELPTSMTDMAGVGLLNRDLDLSET